MGSALGSLSVAQKTPDRKIIGKVLSVAATSPVSALRDRPAITNPMLRNVAFPITARTKTQSRFPLTFAPKRIIPTPSASPTCMSASTNLAATRAPINLAGARGVARMRLKIRRPCSREWRWPLRRSIRS